MKVAITRADGSVVELPAYDPMLSEYIERPSSNVPTLCAEINGREIYAPLFKGKSGLTFLDIGANIGLVSLYAYPACSRIVAVEPDPETFGVLGAATVQYPLIERFQAALAPKDGPCTFWRNPENTTASSSVNTFGEKTAVTGLTLSSILRIHQLEKVHVCKVDCEGAEELSLTAFELLTAAPIIDCYVIECHNTPTTRWESTLARLQSTLNYLGYTKQNVDGMRLLAYR